MINILTLDHLVLTVKNIDKTLYEDFQKIGNEKRDFCK